MDLEKVKVILHYPMPHNITKIRVFYGIRNFSGICGPIIECTKEKTFHWSRVTQRSFELLKKVIEAHVFVLPNFNKVFKGDCNTTSIAIGVVLSKGW